MNTVAMCLTMLFLKKDTIVQTRFETLKFYQFQQKGHILMPWQ